jgi:hypothetical protein
MLNWFLNTGHKLFGVIIFLTQLVVHWEDIIDRFAGWMKFKHLYERRKNEMEKYMRLIPILEKLASDLEAASQSPQDQAVVADIKALIADISASATPTA